MDDKVLFTSTRSGAVSVDGGAAAAKGIPDDGGLFVPTSFPKLKPADLSNLGFGERAARIVKQFFDTDMRDFSFDDEQANVVKLDNNLFMLELWHGDTFSYGDIALSLLPRIVSGDEYRKTLLLVASDGNIGVAAKHAFGGAGLCLFKPDTVGGLQKLAQSVQPNGSGNVKSDIQPAVRAAYGDESLKQALAANNICLTTADCSNIACIIPLIAYYFSAYCDLLDSGEIRAGDSIDYIVPIGSPGNIIAGLYAKRMGLPINKLVCACDSDSTFATFIETGTYDINRECYGENAADVTVSGNLERLLYYYSGDAQVVAERMAQLCEQGRFSVTPEEIERIRDDIACDGDDDYEEAICDMFDEYGYLADPLTAVAYAVANRRECVRATVVVSTAHPYKHAKELLEALGEPVRGNISDMVRSLEDISAIEAPNGITELLSATADEAIAERSVADYIRSKFLK